MGITLYYFQRSPPARCALMVCRALGIDVNLKIVNLNEKQHMKPEFLKINPQHVVPTLVDGDLILWESAAICSYLANAYPSGDFYPSEPKLRAVVDQRLFFNTSTLFPTLRNICLQVLFHGKTEIPSETKKAADDGLMLLNIFLEGNDFVAGNGLTIADMSLVATVSSFEALGWNLSHKNVVLWLERCKSSIPGYTETNQLGAEEFGVAIRSKLSPGQL